jgi:hypothetical protein
VTFSVIRPSAHDPPVETPQINTFAIFTLRNTGGVPPALRTVSVADGKWLAVNPVDLQKHIYRHKLPSFQTDFTSSSSASSLTRFLKYSIDFLFSKDCRGAQSATTFKSRQPGPHLPIPTPDVVPFCIQEARYLIADSFYFSPSKIS